MPDRRTLTRADLREAARRAAATTTANALPSDGERIVDQTLDIIADELVDRSGKVLISGFGTFVVVRSPPRIGRNPKRPKEEHAIPATSRAAFRASLDLRARVNGERPDG